ncbi:MAG: AAA family ATPase [Candidatus Rokubacteria bacterium]|nr:AAA family ATPase [Candidatus Rokubacteria bacterium]
MIKRLRVHNYLSLRDIDLELGRRNLVVGPNMSGKSNLIDCLRFLTTMVTSGLNKAFEDRAGFQEVVWKGADGGRFSIGLTTEVPVEENEPAKIYAYEISIVGSGPASFAVEKEQLTVKTNGASATLIDLKYGQGKLTHADGSTEIASSVAPNSSALEFNIPGWEGTSFKFLLSAWRFYRLIPALMKQPNAASAQNFLNERGDNFSSWMMTLQTSFPEEFRRVKQVAMDVLPGLEEILTPPTQYATTYVATRERYLSRPVNIWRMSDGELNFLALLSLIFAPESLGSPLYCIEEPENHLHPKLLETLVEVLTQRQNELGSQAAQVVVTTHSAHLVDRMTLDELIVTEKSNGATRCLRPASKKHLKELLEREELGLGELWYSGALGGA